MEGNYDPYYIPDMTYPSSNEPHTNSGQFIPGVNTIENDWRREIQVRNLQENDTGKIRFRLHSVPARRTKK